MRSGNKGAVEQVPGGRRQGQYWGGEVAVPPPAARPRSARRPGCVLAARGGARPAPVSAGPLASGVRAREYCGSGAGAMAGDGRDRGEGERCVLGDAARWRVLPRPCYR